ncbi:SDR family NAD(P)-dependent oxidoreductase [Halioxenophilus sp. WMMB6]|uniref:SDR family NAD(P)-dependent oxidoreductase n=1 Tax=Halioxenophilus sp. WMMB6 TaxID=3073815 RepID=UPI00295E3096|nr:SDR family NAD(P)-dependent oxidoreductase [Halioxenophilus sp. WMMB6]
MFDAKALLNDYGPCALITGASSGIGLALATNLASAGFNLVLAARRTERLQSLATHLTQQHAVDVVVLPTDLAELAQLDELLSATRNLDIGLVISNAGFSTKGEFSAVDRAQMLAMLQVNCQAPLVLAHGFIPRLQQRQSAGIIFTSSVEALLGCPYSTAYSATKALVKNLGEGLWAELKEHNIDVLTLCPGATDTEALSNSGLDASKMTNVMSADEVAKRTLANIKNGPVFISSPHYQQLFEQLTALPREQALLAMAKNMRP